MRQVFLTLTDPHCSFQLLTSNPWTAVPVVGPSFPVLLGPGPTAGVQGGGGGGGGEGVLAT